MMKLLIMKKKKRKITIDFGEILNQTDQELKRLGWTSKQGQKYLLETYGKHSRKLLEDDELLEFLEYLQNLDISVEETINNEEKEEKITIDFGDILNQTDQELKRLGWTSEKGQEYLLETYGKHSRKLLEDDELLEFLEYLQNLDISVNEIINNEEKEEKITIDFGDIFKSDRSRIKTFRLD